MEHAEKWIAKAKDPALRGAFDDAYREYKNKLNVFVDAIQGHNAQKVFRERKVNRGG